MYAGGIKVQYPWSRPWQGYDYEISTPEAVEERRSRGRTFIMALIPDQRQHHFGDSASIILIITPASF